MICVSEIVKECSGRMLMNKKKSENRDEFV